MTHAAPSTRQRWLLWAIPVVLVVVAVIVFLAKPDHDGSKGSSLPRPANATAHQIARFSGDGGTTTKSFTVALNWELRWTAAKGSGFTVELLKADGTSRGIVVQSGSRASGSTFVGEAGSFKLKVTSSSSWTVEVRSR